jgi:ATP-dependent Clp protease, protease subunit
MTNQLDRPIRCFDGNAKPHEAFWSFVDSEQSESGQTELELDGVISEFSWMGDEVTPKLFKDQLYAMGKGGPVLLKVNSPGGDVIAASRMRAILTDYPGEVTARVEGMAASAAVAVVMAASKVEMMDSAYMMIHDPAVVVFMAHLDIQTLGDLRDDLKSIKDGIVPVYAQRTGLDEGKISRMMTDETWMSAREAVDLGFADAVINGGQKARNKSEKVAFVNALHNYQNVPPALLASMDEPALPETVQPSAADVERAQQIKSLREFIDSIRK